MILYGGVQNSSDLTLLGVLHCWLRKRSQIYTLFKCSSLSHLWKWKVRVCSVGREGEDQRRGVGRLRHGRHVLEWPWKSLSSELPPVIEPSLKSWHGRCPWHRQRSERAQDWAPVPLEPDNNQMASSRQAFIWDTVEESDWLWLTITDCVIW